MAFFPAALDNLIDRFASLPGIGRKSAQRLAFYGRTDGQGQSASPSL